MSTLRSLQLTATVTLTLVAAMLAHAADPAPARTSKYPTLYERIDGKLSKQPDLEKRVGRPTPELQQMEWLLGYWEVTATVFATSQSQASELRGSSTVTRALDGTWFQIADEYFGKPQDIGFITYNPVTRKWVAAQVDASGNSITTTSDGWAANKLVFSGKVLIVGEEATLRQTIEKVSDREYVIGNEERLPNGQWVALDRYVYRKPAEQPASTP